MEKHKPEMNALPRSLLTSWGVKIKKLIKDFFEKKVTGAIFDNVRP